MLSDASERAAQRAAGSIMLAGVAGAELRAEFEVARFNPGREPKEAGVVAATLKRGKEHIRPGVLLIAEREEAEYAGGGVNRSVIRTKTTGRGNDR